MIRTIEQQYQAQFQSAPILIKAPGRINLIGEHTDYNNGFVMPAAIDKAMYFAMGKTRDRTAIQILSASYDQLVTIEEEQKEQLPSWAKYLEAILAILKEQGHQIEGINCVFGGDIPIGAGLSSSAALCCGFIYGISTLFDLKMSRPEIALIAQQAEHRIGLNCGLMDQYAVLFGKENLVFCLDCKSLGFDYFPLALERHSLVLIDSKIEHELEGSPYNDRRESCERVVAYIAQTNAEVQSLRDVTIAILQAHQEGLDPLDFQRAEFVLRENERVMSMIKALEMGDFQQAGDLLFAGHEGLSKAYDVSLPEIDFLVDLARQSPDIIGARMMGGGFGGCTLNLIENKNKAATLDQIKKAYHQATGVLPEAYEVALGDGVKLLD